MVHGGDEQQVVAEARWLLVADIDFDDGIGAASLSKLGRLVDADGPNKVGPRPFHEPQIICIINDAVGIRVFKIDGKREMVLRSDEAAAVGRVEVGTLHPGRCSERRLRP